MRKKLIETAAFLLAAAATLTVGFLLSPARRGPAQQPTVHGPSLPGHSGQLACRLVFRNDGSGSGVPVAVTPQGFTVVLTAKHVIDAGPQDELCVRLGDISATVVRIERHPELDLAAVWIQTRLPVIQFDMNAIQFGERIQAAGWIFGEYLTLVEGLVSNPGQFSADVLPGCSGGPVIRNGRLIGILVACLAIHSPFGRIPIGAQADFVEISVAQPWLESILPR